MAGESPDRSKQHESSAEPTSGSKAPVPDPRLAVAREAVKTAARVDTATAVFSTKRSAGSADSVESVDAAGSASAGSTDAEPDAEEAAGPAAGSSRGSDGSAEPESAAEGAGKGTGGGDGRPRSAEAAGAATADDEAPEGAPADASADADADAVPDGGSAEAEVEAEAGDAAGAGSGSGSTPGSGSGVGSADPTGGATDADADTDRDSEPPQDTVASADTPAGDAVSDGIAAGGATRDGDTGRDSEPRDAAASADASAEDAVSGGTAAEPDDGRKSEAGPADEAEAKAPEAAASEPEAAEPEHSAPRDTPATEASAESPAEAPTDAPAKGTPPKPDATPDAAPKDGTLAFGASTADAKADAERPADEPEAKPEPPVDQATAIFKRPPSVDQPTTMLKLGGGAKPDAGPGKTTEASEASEAAKAKAKAKPEQPQSQPQPEPAERTSKFVALKPLDEPAQPKAGPTAPSATPSGPPSWAKAAETTVTPQIGPERTTQQPLPPKPPLDLLAELTNTPAPRQTPVRTIVRRVKIWTPLVLLLAAVFAVAQAVRPLPTPSLALTAAESYAFKGDKVSLPWPEEGQGWMDVNGIGTVDSFGEQKPVAIGSVAKAMTAYVILKEHPLKAGADGAKVPVDAKAEKEGGYDAQGESTLNTVKAGDTLTEKDAIAAIMIPSANNIARLLARWDAGSEAKFVAKMNAAAKDLGMKDTKYTDPSGLEESTVSTAEDQVKLGNELVRIKALIDITKLPTWVDPSGKKWDNYNRLVPYNNAIGLKTGSTTKAGGNLLFAATQEVGGENVIVVGAILGQHTPPIIDTVNAVSKTAMVAAQESLTSQKILKKGDVVGYVDDGLGGQSPVVVTKDVSAVGWAGQTVKLKLNEGDEAIPHEAKAGTEVGSLSVGDGTAGDAVEVPVALQSDLAEPGFGAKLTRVA
ncbi:D-alanyl-D-alanine carboxypeptidase (plasmid) [Streptomyces sp. CWNU-52B]|uniref:D-alanyl-D-alanine carboxypeptidase n=1 Tax=unclassified Streptomyces TaxID=2593676 RepID=UPI0039BEF045